MSAPNSEEVNTRLTSDDTHSLGSLEVEDVGNAAASSSVRITSEEVARQIKAATDPVRKQLEKHCDLTVELQWDKSRRSEETSSLVQCLSRTRGDFFDNYTLNISGKTIASWKISSVYTGVSWQNNSVLDCLLPFIVTSKHLFWAAIRSTFVNKASHQKLLKIENKRTIESGEILQSISHEFRF